MVNTTIFVAALGVFVAITLFLGWYGYKHTKNQDQFMLGKNKSNPMLIGLAYGASFLSASAIVGFGGMAAKYGMMMMWLVFLNLFVGLVIAFIVFGKRTRRLNTELGALTFADFLGKRFRSSFIRTLTAVIVLVGMPIYCAAVLVGGVNFLTESGLGLNKDLAILALSVVVLLYVAYGGIIAVMYNDALQAAIMFAGMLSILLVTYFVLGETYGGISGIHQGLTDLWSTAGVPGKGNMEGMVGWTKFPELGSNAWIYAVSTLLMGVGIGALAQPQLAARFMTAKDTKTLNRSLLIGGIFMIVIVGSAYTVGALTNLYYGESSVARIGNIDKIIPTFVNDIFGTMGGWGELFIIVFILAILCAAISTMCVLLHTMGAAAGYDLWSEAEKKIKRKTDSNKPSLRRTRISTVIMMVVVIVVAYMMPPNIIAKATSIFMGLTAAALLPAFAHAVFSKNPRTGAAKVSMAIGSVIWLLWALFINESIGLIIGTGPVVTGKIIYVDPLIIALPISSMIMLIGCYIKPKDKASENSGLIQSSDTKQIAAAADAEPQPYVPEEFSRYQMVWPGADVKIWSRPKRGSDKKFGNNWPEHLMKL